MQDKQGITARVVEVKDLDGHVIERRHFDGKGNFIKVELQGGHTQYTAEGLCRMRGLSRKTVSNYVAYGSPVFRRKKRLFFDLKKFDEWYYTRQGRLVHV